MSRQVLKTVTVPAHMGESTRPAAQEGGTWELFGVTIDKSPHIIWHTYVLLEDAPPPVVVRAVVRYTPDPKMPPLDIDSKIGQDVAIMRIDRHGTAFCLPMEGGPIFAIANTRLEIAPGTDAADVQALYRH